MTGPTLNLFSQRFNRECANLDAANTPLGLILGVDFEIESVEHTLAPVWQAKLSSGELGKEEAHQAMRQYNNVVKQTTIVWRARKSGQA